MNVSNQPGTRRKFLLATGRSLGIGGLAALVIGQEIKTRRLANDPNCIKLQTCKDCIEFQGCGKPKAEDFRRNSS